MSIVEEAQAAARALRGHAYVRILAREDGDAICAATLLAHALRREGIDFHVSWLTRLEPLAPDEQSEALVLLGLGSDATLPPALLALDADANASLAARAQLVAVALNPRNVDLAPLALAGALAGKRHIGGLAGLDGDILAQAADGGVVARSVSLAIRGPTLVAALSSLDEPYLAGVTGRARNAKKLATDLALPSESTPAALSAADAERLGSALAARILEAGAPDAALDALFRPRILALKGPHGGLDAWDLALAAEAAAARGRGGLAFAALWPDEASAAELGENAAGLRDELVATLLKAEREGRREGPLVVVDAPSAGLCAPLASRVACALVPPGQVAVARHADSHVTTLALRAFGRDVAPAARAAADACGGSAWGAAGAARASVPSAEEGRFLKLVGEALA